MNFWNYIVLLRPTRLGMLVEPTPEEMEAVGDHYNYYKSMVEQGQVLLAGRTGGDAEQVYGIGIFHAESMLEAESIAQKDPAIVAGVMTAEVQPYGLALLTENPHRLP